LFNIPTKRKISQVIQRLTKNHHQKIARVNTFGKKIIIMLSFIIIYIYKRTFFGEF